MFDDRTIEFKMEGAAFTTNGKGLWSSKSKTIKHPRAELGLIHDDTIGELRVFFDKDDWYVDKIGLIYTDPQWERELHQFLVEKLGFTEKAAKSVGYSEAGMQGNDYVSLDVGDEFIKECIKKFGVTS